MHVSLEQGGSNKPSGRNEKHPAPRHLERMRQDIEEYQPSDRYKVKAVENDEHALVVTEPPAE